MNGKQLLASLNRVLILPEREHVRLKTRGPAGGTGIPATQIITLSGNLAFGNVAVGASVSGNLLRQ